MFKSKKIFSILAILLGFALITSLILLSPAKEAKALSWEKVLDMAQLSQPNNEWTFQFKEFKGKLYVGLDTNSDAAFAQVWVTEDGQNWSQVTGYTSAYQVIPAMEVLGDYLYVASMVDEIILAEAADQSIEIKRTSDGVNWETVVDNNTWGDSELKAVWSMKTFKGNLYATVLNYEPGVPNGHSNGMEIWRTSSGTGWERVVDNGFGDPDNFWAIAAQEFNGELYVGTFNFGLVGVGGVIETAQLKTTQLHQLNGGNWTSNGAEVWRTADGDEDSWTQVNTSGFNNDPTNCIIYMMAAYKGYLYAGVWNFNWGGNDSVEFWRASDGQNWSQVDISGLITAEGGGGAILIPMIVNDVFWMGNDFDSGGAGLFYSTDAANWQQEGERGFGDTHNIALDAMTLFNNYMYLGFGNTSGAQIWRTGPINPLSITTESLPDGITGDEYSAVISSSSGTLPYTFSVQSGDLPPGLSLTGVTSDNVMSILGETSVALTNEGVLSGTPEEEGTYDFTVLVTDGGQPEQTTTHDYTLTISQSLPATGADSLLSHLL